ncbi:MAG: GNAT family N-acetyltransferase [Dehalococcoidales bacterium]|nr:GNAT family N-acetyltransferase [Dehalococcoidales bacterium]
MAIRIRPMVADDRSALMRILRATPEFKTFEVDVAEEVIDSYLRDPVRSGYHVLVAEDEDGVCGYICYGETPCTIGTWDIYWVAVAREKRRKGIGKLLSGAAEAAIRKACGRMIVIETSSTPLYENTRRFYAGQGYEVIARVPDFYAPGDDKLILRKLLETGKEV